MTDVRKFAKRYLTDMTFRVRVGLYGSLLVNLIFAAMKFISALLYDSLWFGAVAAYYAILGILRFLLLRQMRQEDGDMQQAWRKYRLCGGILIALNLVLAVIAVQMIRDGKGVYYPGVLIYAAAAYTFYALTAVVVSVVRYRGQHGPVLSAVRTISLSAGLVSIFSLQTAMFSSFGGGEALRYTMNLLTGSGVCMIVFVIAVYMVTSGTRMLKQK